MIEKLKTELKVAEASYRDWETIEIIPTTF